MKATSVVLLNILLLIVTACTYSEKSTDISQIELISRINDYSAPTILDVRTGQQYISGHIPGAMSIPYDNHVLALAKLALNKSDEIVVYSEDSDKARNVESYLKKKGFFEVRYLQGGMRGWRRAELPIE